MRYTVFEHKVANSKGYSYSREQLKYIIDEINSSRMFVYLQEPSQTLRIDSIVGRLVNPLIEGDDITAELELLKTPMAAVAETILNSIYSHEVILSGLGIIRNGKIEDYELIGAFMVPKPVDFKV